MKNEQQPEKKNNKKKPGLVPRKRVAGFLSRLEKRGGLKSWDKLCEELYPKTEPAERIHRFAQHLDLWRMPLKINFTTLSVLLRLANEFHADKRSHECLAAIGEAEARVDWNVSPTEGQEIERLRRIAKFANRALSTFPAMALGAFAEVGSLNWTELAGKIDCTPPHARARGPGLVKAGYLEDCPSGRYKKRITNKGRQELKRLTKPEV